MSMSKMLKECGGIFPETSQFETTILEAMQADDETKTLTKKDLKMLVLPFAKFMRVKVNEMGEDILRIKSKIDEQAVLKENLQYVSRTLKLEDIFVVDVSTDPETGKEAYPGNPAVHLEKVEDSPSVEKTVEKLSLS